MKRERGKNNFSKFYYINTSGFAIILFDVNWIFRKKIWDLK